MKLPTPRLLETAKLMATQAGQQLGDLIVFATSSIEQIVRALRNNLSVADNFNSQIAPTTLTHATPQIINTNKRQPSQIMVGQVLSQTYGISALPWYMDQNSNLVVTPYFFLPRLFATWARASNVVTVTTTVAHSLSTGQTINLKAQTTVATAPIVLAAYVVTLVDSLNFTFAHTAGADSGSLYFESVPTQALGATLLILF